MKSPEFSFYTSVFGGTYYTKIPMFNKFPSKQILVLGVCISSKFSSVIYTWKLFLPIIFNMVDSECVWFKEKILFFLL